MNLTGFTLSPRGQKQENMHYGSVQMKGKNRQNQSLVTEARVVIALGEEGLVTGREHMREPSGMLGMFDTHM